MPVDYCACILPLLIFVAAIVAAVGGRSWKAWRWVTGGLIALFLLIYFVPGWVLWVSAQSGDPEAQYQLGNYYWTRLGYMASDIEARDRWWVEAARQGHPHAMYTVGYFSTVGSSRHIPRDPVAAKRWLQAAKEAGDPDAESALRKLAEEDKAR